MHNAPRRTRSYKQTTKPPRQRKWGAEQNVDSVFLYVCSAMMPKAKSAIFTGVVWSCHWTRARKGVLSAFVTQLPPTGHPWRGRIPAHERRCLTVADRSHVTPLFSATDEADKTQQLSDIDARVIDELLSDTAFLESFMEQELQLEGETANDGEAGMMGNNTRTGSVRGSALGLIGEAPARPYTSVYESATLQAVEGVQLSVKGIVAKVSAAFESAGARKRGPKERSSDKSRHGERQNAHFSYAFSHSLNSSRRELRTVQRRRPKAGHSESESEGIYIGNRAQMDTKVVQAVAEYASTQAAAGTSRLLLAASGAASPALLLMGINTTETQAALNDSVQLLSMGIAPDSVRFSPRLLSSFKDFDDDDKRLDAAFRRQRRRRSKPLPVRLLGSLPSTINKAADLAYEVEQEVKYERAGSRANKFLRPMGISLPQAKEKGLLMERTPSESGVERLEARETNVSPKAAVSSPTPVLGSSVVESTPSAGKGTPASPKSGLLRDASPRRDPMPPAPHPFGGLWSSRRETANVVETPHSAGMKVSGSTVEPALAVVSASELTKRITSVDTELRLQARGVRAAHAVLCSTEPIITGLSKSSTREEVLLEELQNVARDVQQMYVLAEMSEAVEAAERYLKRLRELSANVNHLAVELQAYAAAAYARNRRLESIRSRLREVRDRSENSRDLEATELDFSLEFSDILKAFDDEIVACQKEAKVVGRPLAVVRQESPERARNEAENAHEDALLAACRLWDASAVEGVGKRAKAIHGIRRDSSTVQGLQVSTPVPENERVKSGGATSEMGQRNLARVSEAEVVVERAESEQSRTTEDGVAHDTASNVQQAHVTQIDGGRSAISARSTSRASRDIVAEDTNAMFVTSGTGEDIARAPGATVVADATTVHDETATEYVQAPSSAELLDATVVYDVTNMSAVAMLRREQSVRKPGGTKRFREGFLPEESTMTASDVSSSDIVLDRSSSYVDIDVEVEDDVSEPTRIGLKVLDVSALLIEKALFVGLPTLVSGGSLVWDRVDNALNGAKGRKGWKLLKRLKKNGMDDIVS